MAINNGEVIGKPQKNLILETAGRIYVKVADRYYELNFRDQGSITKMIGIPQVAPTESPKEEIDLSDYVTSSELKQTLKKYVTERSWQDVKDTQTALENAMIEGFSESINPITVQTMQVTVGSEQFQFDIVKSFTDKTIADAPLYLDVENEYRLTFNPCFIRHYTIDGPEAVQPDADKEYWRWYIDCSDNWNKEDGEKEIITLSNETYYFYFKVPFVDNIDVAGDDVLGGGANGANLYTTDGQLANKTGSGLYAKTGVGKLVYTKEAQEFKTVDANGVTWYNLLYAIVTNGDGDPSISTMNGYTEILPGQVTAYLFKNASGSSYLDLNSNQFVLGVDPENPLLAFNQDGNGTLYLKGAIVQDKNGNSQAPTIYRDAWNANNTYCPGNIVIYSNADGVVGSYRFTGIAPSSSTGSLEEYERECGTAGNPIEDTEHWVCVSSGSKTIVTSGLYYVDSDNDFIAAPTDSDDLILLDNINADITLTMYEGSNEMNITKVDVSIPETISNAVTIKKAVNGNIKIQNISFIKGAKFTGTEQITFQVTASSTTDSTISVTKDFKFTVSAVKNADPTTIYQLGPSLSIIKKDASNNYQEENISCDVIKISSNGREIVSSDWNTSGIVVTYKIDDGASKNYSYGAVIKTSSIKSKIEFALTIKSVTWDKETIFVVSDGSKGADGTIISSVLEYYYATINNTLSSSEKDYSKWTLNNIPSNYGVNAPYLWNCEVVQDNLGNTLNTPIYALISYYGKDGKGISNIKNYYLATSSNSVPAYGSTETEIMNNGWQTSASTTNFSETGYKYLWNLEIITYTDNSFTITEPAIISILTEGVRGADAPIVRYSKWATNTVYNNGTKPETVDDKSLFYLDFVYDPITKQYYQCNTSHTSGVTFAEDLAKWTLINNYKPIATSVIFAGDNANGWIIDEGEIKHTGNKALLTNAGEIYLGNSDTSKEPSVNTANFSVDADGKVTVKGDVETNNLIATAGTLDSLVVKRSMNPFVLLTSSSDALEADNVYTMDFGLDGSQTLCTLDWSPASSGRKTIIIGGVSIDAPDGMYFYENGRKSTSFESSYECTEMVGWGTGATTSAAGKFYGWIILKRTLFSTHYNFGRDFSVLAFGRVDGSSTNSASFAKVKWCNKDEATVDGLHAMIVAHAGTKGHYYLYCPRSWFASEDYIYVDLTGYGYTDDDAGNHTAISRAGVAEITATTYNNYDVYRIEVVVADDATANNGSFFFKIYNMAQWDD